MNNAPDYKTLYQQLSNIVKIQLARTGHEMSFNPDEITDLNHLNIVMDKADKTTVRVRLIPPRFTE